MKKLIFAMIVIVQLLAMSSIAYANNPIISEDDQGNRVYAGDPAILVDGDTVYLFVGHDTSTTDYYYMPEWLCYSSTDLLEWKYEGVPMKASDFSWGSASDAWAGQVAKYKDKYYFYMCKNSTGISVGVSDTATGPYTDARNGAKLIEPGWTSGKVGWDDIDPTVWIETDENGVEHRYLCWGNSNCYIAELNEDMISLVDVNNDGTINGGDITEIQINNIPSDSQFTEAPWIYKRDDVYYLFFASDWREELSYATSKNIAGPYEYGGKIMEAGASSNTNHPAVFDFKGKTYIVYHTGALPWGSGYRRSVCIDELVINADGTIDLFEESSIGLDGTAVYISPLSNPAHKVYHGHIANSTDDTAYPMGSLVYSDKMTMNKSDFLWEIIPGRGSEEYVSIQSVNKIGYFITNDNSYVELLHDEDAQTATAQKMTFIQHEGLAGEGVSYESMSERGKYLTVSDNRLILTDGSDKEASTFVLTEVKRPAELDVTTDENGITFRHTYTGTSPIAMLLIKDASGKNVNLKLFKTKDIKNIEYTYKPENNGYYTVIFGDSKKVVKY